MHRVIRPRRYFRYAAHFSSKSSAARKPATESRWRRVTRDVNAAASWTSKATTGNILIAAASIPAAFVLYGLRSTGAFEESDSDSAEKWKEILNVSKRGSLETMEVSDVQQLADEACAILCHRGVPLRKLCVEPLTIKEVTAILRQQERTVLVPRGRGVKRFDVVQVPCNTPVEDDHSEKLLPAPSSSGQGDWMFWGIYDGHR